MKKSRYSQLHNDYKEVGSADIQGFCGVRPQFFENRIDQVLTAEEAAKFLRVSTKALYRWAKVHRLPSIRMGRTVRFRRSDLEDIVCGRRDL
jgi:excisionase family DNA binding protein